MENTALIFGAGKTGRGFAAHLAFLGGYRIILIDKNKQLITELQRHKQYDIEVLAAPEKNCKVLLASAYVIDDESWHREFVFTQVAFTAVFGNNLEDLSRDLALALQRRFEQNPKQLLTIITCENLATAATVLKQKVLSRLGVGREAWLEEVVSFTESIVFRTCLEARPGQPELTIRAQNFFELPCDGDSLKEPIHIVGLKPSNNFANQLRRKIYTYNCINAVIAYLGAEKGHQQLNEAACDNEILAVARQAAIESSYAQIKEFDFDQREQEEWVEAAFKKFSDKHVPDPIERNAVDPVRKLGRDDRLIGPALLALKHNMSPEALLTAIISCFHYRDQQTKKTVTELAKAKGIDYVLQEICGLTEKEELYTLIRHRIDNVNQ